MGGAICISEATASAFSCHVFKSLELLYNLCVLLSKTNTRLLSLSVLNIGNRPFYSCVLSWPLNENEAGGDLVLIETSLLFLCKFVVISMRRTSLR